jgi:hypothetical protein
VVVCNSGKCVCRVYIMVAGGYVMLQQRGLGLCKMGEQICGGIEATAVAIVGYEV